MSTTAQAPTISPLLTVQDVAEILQVSRATVYGLIQAGKLEPVKLGLRKTRFRRADILRFIGEDDVQ